MALKKSVERFGVTFPNAVHRVNTVKAAKPLGFAVEVEVFSDQNAIDNQKEALAYLIFNFDYANSVDGSNPIEQGYHLLKTLQQYDGAVDC